MAINDDNSSSQHPPGWAFFSGGEFGRRLDLLRHLAQSSQLLLLVVGPEGTGKTTLLNELEARAEHYWRTCRVQAIADMDAAGLLKALARCADLPTDCGEEAMQLLLVEHAANLEHASHIPVAMVDDAHLLTASARATLVKLGRPGPQNPHPWHILLFGQAGVESDIDEADRHTVQLGPLSPDQLGAYIHRRLQAAGYEHTVGPEEIKRLYKASHGLPGLLEPLLAGVMQPAAPPAVATEPPPSAVPTGGRRRLYVRVGIALAILLVLGTLLVFQDRINALFQGPGGKQTAPAQITTAQAPIALPEEPAAPDQSDTLLPQTPVMAENAGNTVKPATPETESPEPAAAAVPAEPAAQSDTTTPAPATTAEPATAPVPPPTATPAETPEPPSPGVPAESEKSAQGDTDSKQAGAKAPVQKTPAEAPAAVPAPTEAAASPETPTTSPAPSPKPAAAKKTPATPALGPAQGHAWVLAQDPHHYTLQVLGSRNEATVQHALRRGGLGDAHYYRIQYHGRDWYVLVSGTFASRSQAARAADKLPREPGAGKPWIRRLQAVQTEVRRGRK